MMGSLLCLRHYCEELNAPSGGLRGARCSVSPARRCDCTGDHRCTAEQETAARTGKAESVSCHFGPLRSLNRVQCVAFEAACAHVERFALVYIADLLHDVTVNQAAPRLDNHILQSLHHGGNSFQFCVAALMAVRQ